MKLAKNVVPFAALTGILIAFATTANAQAPQIDQAQRAAIVLNSARTAFNEKQFEVAIQRFDEYLREFGNTPDAVSARFGWGLCLLEGPLKGDPQQVYRQAIEQLNPPAADKNFADNPLAVYYQGLAWRRLGHDCLKLAAERPNEAPQRINEAAAHFTQALPKFTEALTAFEARAAKPAPEGAPAPDPKQLAPDLQWAARARCDQAEMLLRLNKQKEALDLTAPFVTDDTPAAKSRYRPLGLYQHGHAAFLLKDHVTAARALSKLAPFTQPAFGNHARYLLARTHHLAGENGEAKRLYGVVQTTYDQEKLAAQQALGNAEIFKNDPEGKARAEALVKAAPDYVARSVLYSAVLNYEEEKFADALALLATFDQKFPGSVLIPEVQLRRGMCQVQLKQFNEAAATLTPLGQHADLGDRAFLWLARAQLGPADPAQPQPFQQALTNAANSLRQAIERAAQMVQRDPEAAKRRVECLVELNDTQLRLNQFPEAVGTMELIVREKQDPERMEELTPRLATAYHLAARYDDADRICREFQAAYPNSALLPAVLFRYGENAFVRASQLEVGKPLAQSPQRKQWLDEAQKRFAPLVEKYPEFENAPMARYRLGLVESQLGQFEAAAKTLATIADADRNGELITVSYHQADALLHTLPEDAGDDALAVGRIIQAIGDANKLLEGYIAAVGTSKPAELPDALVKLGHCQQRTANLIAEPMAKTESLTKARQAYERVMNEFNTSPVFANSIYERAKVMSAQNDINGAINELNRFRGDPLRASSVAPLALLRMSALMRSQNRVPEAITVLAECRAQHEGAMRNDPTRVAWVPLVIYHHGVALKEQGAKEPPKLAEARTLFEAIVRDFPAWPQTPDAAWRAGQCTKEEALVKLEASRTLRAKPGATPQELAQAQTEITQTVDVLRRTAEYFRTQAAALAAKALGSPSHQRMLYEAAWCARTVGEEEIEALRRQKAEEARVKRQQELTAKYQAANLPVPNAGLKEISLKEIPQQPGEKMAGEQYQALITAGDSSLLALRARLELAEHLASRDDLDGAMTLLLDALDLEPPTELEQRMRLVLGDCMLAKGAAAEARDQLLAIVADETSPLAPQARYRAGECCIALQEWAKAIELLLPFRDHGPLQNLPNLSDRAVLRLGHAYAGAGTWDQSRYSNEILLGRFPNSVWKFEARYGFGFALQSQSQWDAAYGQYQQLTRETATEPAARAQLQMGRCRLAQQRYEEAAKDLLAVPATYDYADWNAAALYDASKAYDALKRPEDAVKQLQRLLNEYPENPLVEPAKERLAQLTPK